MLNKLHFLLVLLKSSYTKHLSIFIISSLLIAIVSSVVFLSSSIKKDTLSTLDNQADFTVQRYKAGKVLNTPEEWIEQFLEIEGVSNVQGRIYGEHYYEPLEEHFLIVGLDFYDTQIINTLQKLIDGIDTQKFLSKKNMLIGSDVKKFFDKYHFFDYYHFRPPDRSIEKVYIYKTLPKESDIVSRDMIIMDISLARTILGVEDGYVTDIIISAPNPLEKETIYYKLRMSHFDMRIISKDELSKYYHNLFNYKGGAFLVLFIITLSTFLLILYQRYSMIKSADAKEIALLRQLGWRIDEIIWFKISENIIVVIAAYIVGVSLAYFYTYGIDAPLLKNIFLGYSNLATSISFSPYISFKELVLVFLFFTIPFIAVIIFPLWRLCIKEPTEVLK